MSLIEKLKNIFKKKEEKSIESKVPVIPNTCKYENMILFAPPKTVHTWKPSYFYITALDKNNNPIVDENIHTEISGTPYDFKTDANGVVKWEIDLPPGKYNLKISFPNGEYSQIIESKINVKDDTPHKNPGKKRPDTFTSLTSHDISMYINNESDFYVKLRDVNYDPLEGEEIEFKLRDEIYKAKTDELGIARLPIKDLKRGSYNIYCKYNGSSEYDGCETTSKLKMLIRDIDKEAAIEVDHVTMEFKVTKDKIDTLKEFIIRTLKRNKEEQQKIKVLNDITFTVYKGDKLGILGFNGAGKSTLLKILSGIYEPTSGSVKINGKIAPLLELGAGFDKNYTGKNNIYLNGSLLSIDEKIIDSKYDEIVEFSELGDFINYPIKNYSSGMKTKLGFSIATLVNPEILILDEVLSVGDIKFKRKSAEKINSLMEEGVTVLLVSHSIKQIEKICDTCIWLENGQIKMQGDAKEVCDAYVKGSKTPSKNKKK